MSRIFTFLAAAVASVLLIGCTSSSAEQTGDSVASPIVISSASVKTELLGLTLGTKTVSLLAEHAFENHIDAKAKSDRSRVTGGHSLKLTPKDGLFAFGGADWTDAELLITKADTLAAVTVIYGPTGASVAQQQYKSLKKNLKAKYGRPNTLSLGDESEGCYWTDGQTTVCLVREPGKCSLRYSLDRFAEEMHLSPQTL